MSSVLSLAEAARYDITRFKQQAIVIEELLNEPLDRPELDGDEFQQLDKILSTVRRVETAASVYSNGACAFLVSQAFRSITPHLPKLEELYEMIANEPTNNGRAAFVRELTVTAIMHAIDGIRRRIPEYGYTA